MAAFGRVLRSILDPFEILYLAVAVATFEHTAWAAAFLFEGEMPGTDQWVWRLRGQLIAVAIDVGMLLTSRFIATSRNRWNLLSLIAAFVIAAIGSFYMQIVYITFHTPEFNLSSGVSNYWNDALSPVISARVIILPILLPLLATVYTLARVTRERTKTETLAHAISEQIETQTHSSSTLRDKELADQVTVRKEERLLLASGQRPETIEGYSVDWSQLTFYDPVVGRWRGPYKSEKSLVQNIRSINTRRNRADEIEEV